MKKNIAIVAGGDSSEIVISLKSADGIYSFIDKENTDRWAAESHSFNGGAPWKRSIR